MRQLEALTVEGRCAPLFCEAEVAHLGMAEATLLGLLVACLGCVASQAGLGLGNGEGLLMIRSLGLVARLATEVVDRMGEPQT